MKIKLDEGAIMPTRAHEWDAGLDLYAPKDFSVPGCYSFCDSIQIGSASIDTGVHVQIPHGFAGLIKSKSGLNVTHGLTTDGLIDSGYTGAICVKLYNHNSKPCVFRAGAKIAQLVLVPCLLPELELVDSLEPTRAQKKLLVMRRLDPTVWLVVKDTPERMEIVHRMSENTKRIIPKGGRDDG